MSNCNICGTKTSYKYCYECKNLVCKNPNCAQGCVVCPRWVCENCRKKSEFIHFRCSEHQNKHMKK